MGFPAEALAKMHALGIRPGALLGDCGSQDFAATEMPRVNAALVSHFGVAGDEPEVITPAAVIFKKAGFDYKCFDVDYRDGTEYTDFHSFAFDRSLYGRFDVTFNSGTSEHLIAPHGLMFFMHHATKVGGLMWHMVPVFGYGNHGLNNLTPKFWHQLAAYNGYEIVHAEILRSDEGQIDPSNFYGEHLNFFDGLKGMLGHSAMAFVVFRKIIDRCFIPPFDIDDPSPSLQTEKLMRDALEPFVLADSLTYEEVSRGMDSLFGRDWHGDATVFWQGSALPLQAACDRASAISMSGEVEVAAKIWEAIVDQFPNHAEAKFQLARAIMAVAQRRAADLVREAAALAPNNAVYRLGTAGKSMPVARILRGFVRRLRAASAS